jgi:hypothetical protein
MYQGIMSKRRDRLRSKVERHSLFFHFQSGIKCLDLFARPARLEISFRYNCECDSWPFSTCLSESRGGPTLLKMFKDKIWSRSRQMSHIFKTVYVQVLNFGSRDGPGYHKILKRSTSLVSNSLASDNISQNAVGWAVLFIWLYVYISKQYGSQRILNHSPFVWQLTGLRATLRMGN